MDTLLMLRGVTHWCADCAAETIHLPVDAVAGDALTADWCCTTCDAAVVLPVLEFLAA